MPNTYAVTFLPLQLCKLRGRETRKPYMSFRRSNLQNMIEARGDGSEFRRASTAQGSKQHPMVYGTTCASEDCSSSFFYLGRTRTLKDCSTHQAILSGLDNSNLVPLTICRTGAPGPDTCLRASHTNAYLTCGIPAPMYIQSQQAVPSRYLRYVSSCDHPYSLILWILYGGDFQSNLDRYMLMRRGGSPTA